MKLTIFARQEGVDPNLGLPRFSILFNCPVAKVACPFHFSTQCAHLTNALIAEVKEKDGKADDDHAEVAEACPLPTQFIALSRKDWEQQMIDRGIKVGQLRPDRARCGPCEQQASSVLTVPDSVAKESKE